MINNYRDFYSQLIIVDGHCDSILEFHKKKLCFWNKNENVHLDWTRLKEGKVNLQFMAFYIEPEYKPSGALARVLELLSYFRQLQEEKQGKLPVVLSKKDLNSIDQQSPSFLLAIEGGEVLEGKKGVLGILHELGFRCMSLTWNQRNNLADGTWENHSGGGLTVFGKEVILEMNRLGMLIDVSHLSDAGFWDVISRSKQPVAATHSCCRALHNHPRNLTDDQLLALRDNQGIVGINFYPGFLVAGTATIDHVIEHLEHAASIAGIDHVGLGSDFDGIDTTPAGLESIDKLPFLVEKLLKRGWKEKDIKKVMGGNYLRVLQRVLP